MATSVRIDVDQLLRDREAERYNEDISKTRKPSQEADPDGKPKKKRKSEGVINGPKPKKVKRNDATSASKHPRITVTLKLGPRPAAPEPFPCCLCVNMSKENLLRVHDPPTGRKDIGVDEIPGSSKGPKEWMAHQCCANVVPETWIDEVTVSGPSEASLQKEKVVFGVDAIVKDRWNLVRTAFRDFATDAYTCLRNAQLARRVVKGCTGLLFSVPKANAPKHSMLRVLVMGTSRVSSTRYYRRLRRKLFFSIRMTDQEHIRTLLNRCPT